MTWYVIGDSHVSVFTGRDEVAPLWPEVTEHGNFKVYHVGPCTAAGLAYPSEYRDIVDAILQTLDPGARLLFVAGEIDCRVHLPEKPELTEIVAIKYAGAFLSALSHRGYSVYALAPPPPITDLFWDGEFSARGDVVQRAKALASFNGYLRTSWQKSYIEYDLPTDLTARRACYYDGIHLSQKALPILEGALPQCVSV